MKNFFVLFALSLLAPVSSAFAGFVVMDANDSAVLPSCGGVIQTKIANYGSDLNLVFSNVSQCSNFDIVSANGERVDYENQKLQGKDQARSGSFTIPSRFIDYGRNEIRVSLKSNSAIHSDTILISFKKIIDRPTPSTHETIFMSVNSYRSLRACGGTVEPRLVNGRLTIDFRDVLQCSNFDIVMVNGVKVDYPSLKLQGTDVRFANFTFPKKFIRRGVNNVRVSLQSNSGETSELIVVGFYNR